MDGDAVLADRRNRCLCATRLVYRARAHGRNSKASALVKPQSVEIVVGCRYPQGAHSLGSQRGDKSFDQSRPDALFGCDCVQGYKFRENVMVSLSDLISREALRRSAGIRTRT